MFISKEKAIALLVSSFTPIRRTEKIKVIEAVGRVLAEDCYSLVNIPVVRASAMDGIAVKSKDFKNGIPNTSKFKLGVDYIRADTGDDFDDAFDTVIQIEDVKFNKEGGFSLTTDKVEPFQNVKSSGAFVREGECLVKKFKTLTPLDCSKLLEGGLREILVLQKPRVVFIPTGSELVSIDKPLARGQNWDTNSFLVKSTLEQMGANPILFPIVRDNKEEIREALKLALKESDIVLLSAGTSKGAEDYTHDILEEMGKLLFHNVLAAPGRPMAGAIIEGKPVINLSGPSIAAFHGLIWCVREVIEYYLGTNKRPRHLVRAILTEDLKLDFPLSVLIRVKIFEDGGKWMAIPFQFGVPVAKEKEGMEVDGIYMTKPNEKSHRAGESLVFEVLK